MDFLNIENVPRWAYSWCYFFATMGVIVLITGCLNLYLNASKLGPMITLLIFLAVMVDVATFFTLFWMCRSSLRNA